MPNHIVFPGGICETGDFSKSWNHSFPDFRQFNISPDAKYPDIFVNEAKDKLDVS